MKKIKAYLGGGGRFIIIILLGIISFSYAMFQGGFVSWFVFYSIVPFLLYSLLLMFIPIKIEEVHREIKPSQLQRGDSARVTVRFQNKTWIPLVFMTIKEIGLDNQSNKYNGLSNQIFLVGWKRQFEWTYELTDIKRGKIHFQGLQLTFADFFGWTIRVKLIEENRSVVVLPKVTEIKYKPLKMQFEHGGVASRFAMVKDTSLVTGIRDYQAGDRYSWIHWKSFAKNETLRTKEFEDRQTQDIFLTIDQSTSKNFEYAVDLAASILQSVIKNHGDISFLSTGKKSAIYPKLKSQHQLDKVMQHLAEIEADSNQSIDSILSNEISVLQSATLILITGDITEQLKQFFVNSTKLNSGIICFVVTDKSEKLQNVESNLMNVKVVQVSNDNFENAFTEVMKP